MRDTGRGRLLNKLVTVDCGEWRRRDDVVVTGRRGVVPRTASGIGVWSVVTGFWIVVVVGCIVTRPAIVAVSIGCIVTRSTSIGSTIS